MAKTWMMSIPYYVLFTVPFTKWHVVNHITETTQPAPFVDPGLSPSNPCFKNGSTYSEAMAVRVTPHGDDSTCRMLSCPKNSTKQWPLASLSFSLYARKEKLNRLNLEILGYPIFEINIHTGTNLKPFVTPTVWFAIFHIYIYICVCVCSSTC